MSFDSKERAWENAKENEEMSREDAAEIEAEELEQELKDMVKEGRETLKEVLLQAYEDFDLEACLNAMEAQSSMELQSFLVGSMDDAADKIAKARIAERNKKAREEYEGWA